MITREQALEIRRLIEKGTTTYTHIEASINAFLLPHLHGDGSLVAYKTRVYWDGKCMMARADLYDTEQNDPDHAPNLWALIRQKDGYRYIEENMAAELAFDYGVKGWWNDELYESRMEGNIYTPATVPTVWRKV